MAAGVNIGMKFEGKKEIIKWMHENVVVEQNSRLPSKEIAFPMFVMFLIKPKLRRNIYVILHYVVFVYISSGWVIVYTLGYFTISHTPSLISNELWSL